VTEKTDADVIGLVWREIEGEDPSSWHCWEGFVLRSHDWIFAIAASNCHLAQLF
jgi:hypothetical protein